MEHKMCFNCKKDFEDVITYSPLIISLRVKYLYKNKDI